MNKYSLKLFDPEEVAAIEVAMWRNYYNHFFVKLLFNLIKLIRNQFGLRGLKLFLAAYYSTKAAMVFRKTGNESNTVKHLEKFFGVIRSSSVERFTIKEVSQLEFEWWKKHREPSYLKNKTLEQTLADAMATLYLTDSKKLRKYALNRAKAMHLRDEAAHKMKKEPDWKKIDKLLTISYQELKKAVCNK